jgi:putative cardiolipin synthase
MPLVFSRCVLLVTRCYAGLTRPLLARCSLAVVCLALGACASLPAVAPGDNTFAEPADAASPLGKMAAEVMGNDPRSGFRLLPVASGDYEARVQMIRQAQHTLDLQYYLFQADDTGKFMMRELRKAAERGVRVRLLVDDLYTSGEDPIFSALSSFPNIEIRLFNPFANGRGELWSRFALAATQIGRVNHRMHNKLVIADNVAAVVGGRNVADEYFMRSTTDNFVDVDLFAIGPVVQDMSALFDYYWNSEFSYPFYSVVKPDSTPEALQRHFDELTIYAVAPPHIDAPDRYRLYTSLPNELAAGHIESVIHANAEAIADPLDKAKGANLKNDDGTVTDHVLHLIGTAEKSVIMVSPYFVPGKTGLKNMKALVDRGVNVTVITNSLASTDEPLVHVGYTHYRKAMLEDGVHIRELSPSLVSKRNMLGEFHGSMGALHAKVAVVDDTHIFIGSMNLDERSAFENTELGLIIDSPELTKLFELRTDRASSYELRLTPDDKIQWVADEGGKDVVFDDEPEASFWTRLELGILGPFVPESQL